MRHTLLAFLLALAATGALRPAFSASTRDLDRLADEILAVSDVRLRGEIRVDPVQSHGMAAIYWTGDYGVIYVDPVQLQRLDLNTWAFIIGHELAHTRVNHIPQGPRREFEADRIGAGWAIEAGYDVDAYVRWIYNTQHGCSDSHGCWSDRAAYLARHFSGDRDTTTRRRPAPDHDDHGHDRPGTRHDHPQQPRARRVPCTHVMPCTHVVPCTHMVMTPWGLRPAHPYDVLHTHDVAHTHDVVYQ